MFFLSFFNRTGHEYPSVLERHLLPDWPDTQAAAAGHVCQVLLGFSHVLVDRVHPFLNPLQLFC